MSGNAGGIGVSVAGGSTLTNTGTITGGAGGDIYGAGGGNGGAGVYLNGGTLIDRGTIIGGAAGHGAYSAGYQGDAVQFGSVAGTFIVDPGAVFSGYIAANPTADDRLVLAGNTVGSLSGFGKSITGFAVIEERAHADWTLSGAITGTGTLSVGASASLTLSTSSSISTIAFAKAGGSALTLLHPVGVTSYFSGFGSQDSIDLRGISASSLAFSGGELTLYDKHDNILDTLKFDGNYQQSDFGIKSDGQGGTELYATAPPISAAWDRLEPSEFSHRVGPIWHAHLY